MGKISVLAPLGSALPGYRMGDVVEWEVPAGLKRLRVEEILYQHEAAGDYFGNGVQALLAVKSAHQKYWKRAATESALCHAPEKESLHSAGSSCAHCQHVGFPSVCYCQEF